jgi:hypothetical protein
VTPGGGVGHCAWARWPPPPPPPPATGTHLVNQTCPLNIGGVPVPLVKPSLVTTVTIYLGSKFMQPHHVHSHIKYGVRLLKPHQYTTMTWFGMKIRPTFKSTETIAEVLASLCPAEEDRQLPPPHFLGFYAPDSQLTFSRKI